MCFNNPTIYTIECISWIIKYLILSMHGATVKKVTEVCSGAVFSQSASTPFEIRRFQPNFEILATLVQRERERQENRYPRDFFGGINAAGR